MRVAVQTILVLALAYLLCRIAPWYIGGIYLFSLGFFLIAVSIVFVAVLSKAYKNWPS